MDRDFWRGKRVFVTGHTGFKGSWLALWLQHAGAEVTGFALAPDTTPNLFELAQVGGGMHSLIGDVRDADVVRQAMESARPDIVLHLAAQALVRESYTDPVATYATNVMGTVHVLEAARHTGTVRAVVNVTSDKCYENREWLWGYREDEPMGGFDPYSSSKGCAELVTSAYRRSYFAPTAGRAAGALVASARAGNVIGGGDWSADRIVPDIMRAFSSGKPVRVRNPNAVRPWQHVLEPLGGYLLLAERLWSGDAIYADGWNFGPQDDDSRPVGWLVERMAALWGPGASWEVDGGTHPHEANYLKLDCSRARHFLAWSTRMPLDDALSWIAEWYAAYHTGDDMRTLTLDQIARFEALQ